MNRQFLELKDRPPKRLIAPRFVATYFNLLPLPHHRRVKSSITSDEGLASNAFYDTASVTMPPLSTAQIRLILHTSAVNATKSTISISTSSSTGSFESPSEHFLRHLVEYKHDDLSVGHVAFLTNWKLIIIAVLFLICVVLTAKLVTMVAQWVWRFVEIIKMDLREKRVKERGRRMGYEDILEGWEDVDEGLMGQGDEGQIGAMATRERRMRA